ncbi:MAG TPA: hypothetical protein VFX49_21505 [Chloroflexota bacterium]|nr:hypothetical protein [Chloroflexota bacterium]
MAIALKPDDQELLREEVGALLQAFPDEGVRARYAPLAAGVEAGELPDETLDAAGELLELGLQSGRIRRQHRANGEQALLRLFNQTPAGRAMAEQTAEVNKALAQLDGQEIEGVRLLMRVPGVFLLQIGTDSLELTLRLGPDGAAVESVGVGL